MSDDSEFLKLGEFWLPNAEGDQILRDLESEHENFTLAKFNNGEFDSFNYCWYENFGVTEFDANGCDYERKGCFIKEGDVVLDIGGNVGIFARRAEHRGASRVISFEPLAPTYDSFRANMGSKTEIHKLGVAGKTEFREFLLHTDFTHVGGGSQFNVDANRKIIHSEKVLCMNVNNLFESGLFDHVDFMKVDIEGGEFELFRTMKDEHLRKIRCVALEIHGIFDDVDEFQKNLGDRMVRLGFTSFVLYYSNFLRTASFWKV